MIIYLKRLKSSKFVRVKAFPMYGGIGVSAPSLHRESTDSLISRLGLQCNEGGAEADIPRPAGPKMEIYGGLER